MCAARRNNEKRLERKTSSPTNLQLTVHLKRNCRVSSKALDKYPVAFCRKNGSPKRTCSHAAFNQYRNFSMYSLKPLTCIPTINTAWESPP